jgi:hypothetical protein
MRRSFRFPAGIGAVAALMLASAPVLAQTSQATKVTGVAGAAGTFSRSIIDITPPNGPNQRSPFRVQANTTVNVPITIGMTADQLGTAIRDAINNDVTLQSLGYSSTFTTPSGTAVPSRPKLTRQVGSFNIVDNQTGGAGISAAPSAFTVEDAPGLPPFGLGALALLIAGLGWRERRRRREP